MSIDVQMSSEQSSASQESPSLERTTTTAASSQSSDSEHAYDIRVSESQLELISRAWFDDSSTDQSNNQKTEWHNDESEKVEIQQVASQKIDGQKLDNQEKDKQEIDTQKVDEFVPNDDSEEPLHTINVRPRSRYKRWFLTLFFVEGTSKEQMIEQTKNNMETLRKNVLKAIACYDVTPTTNRKHIHLGIVFSYCMSYETLKRTFGSRNHFESIRGSWDGVVQYILGPSPKECILKINIDEPSNVFPKPKSPMRSLFESVVQSKSPEAVLAAIQTPGNEVAAVHYRSAINYLKETWRPRLDPVFRLKIYICGAPGAGKTHLAYELCKGARNVSVITFSPAGQLVGAHDNADAVLFDDLNLSNKNIPHELLFQLLDSYELKVDVKGSTINYCPRLVVITRCEMPADFVTSFQWQEKETAQFSRRLDYIIRVEKTESGRILHQVDKTTGEESEVESDFFVFHIGGILN